MNIRKIRPEEVKRTEELFRGAFHLTYSEPWASMDPMDLYETKSRDPKSREDLCLTDRYGAFDDQGVMQACVFSQKLPVYYNGTVVPARGIGGVSSLPAFRRQGAIRGCFEAMLADELREGTVLSMLYPFSTAFYGKFGYGTAIRRKTYTLKLSHLPDFDVHGTMVLADPSNRDSLSGDADRIYRAFAAPYSCMVDNGPFEYAFLSGADPYKTNEYIHIFYSKTGEPKALASWEPDGRTIRCFRFWFTDREALEALLSLAKNLAADFDSIVIPCPPDLSIEPLLREFAFGAVDVTTAKGGAMARLVDLRTALRLTPCRGSGTVSLAVTDPMLKENTGCYTLAFREGCVTDIAEAPLETAGPEVPILPIGRLTAFLLGGLNETEALYCRDIDGAPESIRALYAAFSPAPSFLNVFF